MVRFLMSRLGTDIKTIQEMAAIEAKNPTDSRPFRLLLESAGSKVEITQEIVEATVIPETPCSTEKLEVLFDLRDREMVITPNLERAAEQNTSRTGKILEVLLRRRPKDFKITEAMMKALVGGQ
ncbi:hypothetical protein LZ31DRAFT_547886 [Colletotrichum somersetense]|nr:hypothetical protein LZ31DRAFT_547886 [Colletotrichum somersetense]